MEDGPGPDPQAPSRRHRADSATRLSVAELLARHSAEPGTATPRRAERGMDETDQFSPRFPHAEACPSGDHGQTQQLFPKGTFNTLGSDTAEPTPAEVTTPEVVDGHASADGRALRSRRIDESLVRLTAIHAGMGAEMTERVSRSSRLPVAQEQAEPAAAVPDGALTGVGQTRLARVGKAFALTMAVLLFIGIGVGWGAKQWLDGKLRAVAALDPNSESIVDKAAQYGAENYLLVGSDTRAGADPADRVGTASTVPGARSDTVMVAHIPAKRDRVVLVSFPRDLAVDRPGCDRWDPSTADYPGGTAPAVSEVKLNTAFEIGGPRCVTKVVQKLTGLSINHFTAIDFAGFKEMVDAVAGVPICLDRPVVDAVLGRVVPTAGLTVLAGDQALNFVRARDVRGDPTADYGRIERQQRFMSALLRKGMSSQVLLSPGKLRALVTAFGSHTLSDNAGLDELTTLANSLRTLDPAKVTFVTVPTGGQANGQGNEELRRSDAAALFEAIRANRPLPGEGPGGGSGGTDDSTLAPRVAANDTVPPEQVRLTVRNGSSRTGLANQVADTLRTVGFTVAGVGDAASAVGTVVRHSPDRADQAATLVQAVPAAVTETVPGPPGQLELVLGDFFDGEVKAPAAVDAAAPSSLVTVDDADASCR